jgi:hypothetical protein
VLKHHAGGLSSAFAWRTGRVERRCGRDRLEDTGKGKALTRIVENAVKRRPERDIRLRQRIEALEALPELQRNNLIEFLDALISAHAALRQYERRAER